MSRWPEVHLGELLRLELDPHPVEATKDYPFVGVYGFGRGLFTRPPVPGASLSAKTLYRVRAGQFVFSRLKAFEGAFGIAGSEHDGRYVSNEFPTFQIDRTRLDGRFLEAYFRRPAAWRAAAQSSTGIGARRERLQPAQLLKLTIPLPPLEEQQRVAAKLDSLSEKLGLAEQVTASVQDQAQHLLEAAFHGITKEAPHRRLGEVAPLTRRPAVVDPSKTYPGVSVRSFGRGTFHNPPQSGSEITWEKPHLVKAGDVLVSNIKAWEGAIAVAGPQDDGRYGSHRYLTYRPVEGVTTARFVCFYLLTQEGLHLVGESSPGSADRNRTTSARALEEIPIPLPSYERQLWFGELYDKVERIRQLQAETIAGREALLPAILDRAFRGEL